MTTEERLEKLEKKFRRMMVGGGSLVVLLLGACTPVTSLKEDGNGRTQTNNPTYEALLGYPTVSRKSDKIYSWSYHSPVDIRNTIKQYPELMGIITTAPQYIEEYERARNQVERRGGKLVPEADLVGAEVLVYGAVMKRESPRVPYRRGLTLLGAIGYVGLEKNAEWRQVMVIRRDTKDPLRRSRVIICDLFNNFVLADVRQDIPLFPGDLIVVPERLPRGEESSK